MAHRITTTRDVQENVNFNCATTRTTATRAVAKCRPECLIHGEGLQKLVEAINPNSFDSSFAAGAMTWAIPSIRQEQPNWLPGFLPGKIDGAFLITVNSEARLVLGILGRSVSVIHDETGNVPSWGSNHNLPWRMYGRTV